MFRNISLQAKIQTLVISISVIIYILAIGYISAKARKTSFNSAITLTNETANKHAQQVRILLEKDLVTVKTLSESVLIYKDLPSSKWKEIISKMYFEVFKQNPLFFAIWDSWELRYIDSTYKKDYGRLVIELYRDNGNIKQSETFKSMTGDPTDYARVKANAKLSLENPYFYSYTGKEEDKKLMTSLISPIIQNNKFIGAVGVDIILDSYHPIINQIKPFEDSYAFLVSHDLKYVAHPDKQLIGESILDDYENIFYKNKILDKITNGEEASLITKDINGVESYFTFSPIIVGDTEWAWSLVVVVPTKVIKQEANTTLILSFVIGMIGLLILSAAIYFASKYLINPINKITVALNKLSLGHIGTDMLIDVKESDEIGQMGNALNVSIKGLLSKTDFARNIGKGNLESDFDLLSDDDSLGQALITMRESLSEAKEAEELRKIEDKKRQWANEGIAKFSDLLRQNNNNIEVLGSEIVKSIIHYLNANQGGLFLYNDDDSSDIHFELIAAYAYNRQKFITKKIIPGEGLVGTCAIEKQTIYLKEIPDSYVEITSGLGAAKPTSLLIAPLLNEDVVLGVLELASFSEFEPYQIEFIEKLTQSIASTLMAVKINIRTAMLLEKTQQQAEEMAAQEEEMRQNMEELQATQEESARKGNEMQGFIDALNQSCYVIEYDPLGYITSINNAYLDLLSLHREDLLGTHHSEGMEMDPSMQKEYDNFWQDLRNGITRKQTSKFTINGKSFTFEETYTPIRDDMGAVYKVLKIANNITNLIH
ncbi:MAG: GAF domain-containing protein [Tenuifilaceae bacterium]|jgi:methyl-accepting chemotaxis protein|nr:GAF domain-containing protein [Tenuifilaceae bacterium]